jgi:hypothetical protein
MLRVETLESDGCGKDGKGATNGSGAQHGSAANPWTAWPEGAAQLKLLTVSKFESGVDKIVQYAGQNC